MRKIDILLIKPGSQKQLYGELSVFQFTAIEPPLWCALLAGHLRGLGYSVGVCDAEVENWSHEETAKEIAHADPLLAVIVVSGTNPSASTMNMTGAGKIASLVKELTPNIKTLLAGLHPSSLPQRTISEEEVDFVCQGEGFSSLPQLLDALNNGADEYPIPGIWYKRNGQVVSNSPAPIITNLDELPMPAWDLLPIIKYRAHNWHCFDLINDRQPYGVIYTSLGCPFRCSFCCINTLFGANTIRYRNPVNVIEEIDYLVNEFGVRNIKIIDEMFALNEERVSMICDMIIERRYDLNMWAYARINTVTKPMLVKMKEAGINWIAYGFESGSPRVLKDVSKGYKVEKIKAIVEMTYELGLYICANFIFGLPEDDFDTMNRTLEMMIDINAEWANIYSAMAYPGSQLYQDALDNGWPLPETWEGYSQYSYDSSPLPTNYLGQGEVLSFRDYAFHAYFENPRYLNKVERLFGLETVKHIQEMSKHRIKRKHAQFPSIEDA